MRGKAKAYACGYIFRFDLKLKTLEVRSIVGLISLKDVIAVQIHGL